MNPQGEINERVGSGTSLANFKGVPGSQWNKTTFAHEMYGNASAALPSANNRRSWASSSVATPT